MLDRIDKEIVRLLIKYKDTFITTNQIAIKTEISPLTAKRHLEKLLAKKYVIMSKTGVKRCYSLKDVDKIITAQSKISWKLNYVILM